MKKLFFIIILLSGMTTQAQESIMKISGGIKLGTGISKLKQKSTEEPEYLPQSSPLQIVVIGGRITGPISKKLFYITELCLSGKGAVITRSYGDSIAYSTIFKQKLSAHPLSILFNLAYRTRAKENTFFLGGGPGVDIQSRSNAKKTVTGCLNLLAGYRFFPGFSTEISCKFDLTSNQYNYVSSLDAWSSTVIALSLAYDF